MRKVAIEDVDDQPNPLQVHEVRKPVSSALGADHFAMNYFELEPGESFSGGLHTHQDQEEVFYVESGTAAFDVGEDRETVTVDAGEVIRFEPGEFQTGYVRDDADESVTGWAFGAPGARHDWDDLESMVHCRDCEEELPHQTATTDEGRFQFTCTECGNSFTV